MVDISMQYATFTDNEESERQRDDWHISRNYWLKRSFELGLVQARVAHNRYQYYCQLLAQGESDSERPY